MRVRTGIRAGFPDGDGRESGPISPTGEVALAVVPRPRIVLVDDLRTGWQRLLDELQTIWSMTEERVSDWWSRLRLPYRSRASPRVEVVDANRLWEVDAWRGFSIGMMISHHLITSWFALLSPVLSTVSMVLLDQVRYLAAPLMGIMMGAMVLSPAFGLPGAGSDAGAASAFTWLRLALSGAAVVFGWWLATLGSGSIWFIFVMGLSMTLSYHRARARSPDGSLFPKYLSRGAMILGWAFLITCLSFLLIPQTPTLFGILHMLGLATILAYPFLTMPAWASLAVAVPTIGLGYWLWNNPIVVNGLWGLPLGFRAAGMLVHDHHALLPWFGVVLIGIAVGKTLYPGGERGFELPDLSETRLVRRLSSWSSNSLNIYMLQEPVHLTGLALLQG